jgi:hypothetical protein
MRTSSAVRVYAYLLIATVFVLLASPAHAQYKPRPLSDPATGEVYHIEGFAGFWFPDAAIEGSSSNLTVAPGTKIDFKKDLGLQNHAIGDLRVALRPIKWVKLRFEYTPINYEQSTVLTREIIFNGQKYTVNLPVNSSLDWKAYRFALETDVVSQDRWFLGFVLDAKYTDVTLALDTPVIPRQSTQERAPVPGIGGIGRVYVVPNISITTEITWFQLPDSLIKNTTGHYYDVDVYGTVNFTNNVGAQVGYRSIDFGYAVDTSTGSSGAFTLKGLYFGIVARY